MCGLHYVSHNQKLFMDNCRISFTIYFKAANPVSMGKTRSKQLQMKEGDYSLDGSSRMGDKVLNVQVRFCFLVKNRIEEMNRWDRFINGSVMYTHKSINKLLASCKVVYRIVRSANTSSLNNITHTHTK